jgi:hypothetical protein
VTPGRITSELDSEVVNVVGSIPVNHARRRTRFQVWSRPAMNPIRPDSRPD